MESPLFAFPLASAVFDYRPDAVAVGRSPAFALEDGGAAGAVAE
jgi:hypothetical protein